MRTNIAELKDGQIAIEITGSITEKQPTREILDRASGKERQVATIVISDESGNIGASLWEEDIDKFNVGDEVIIKNGSVTSLKGSKHMRGRVEKVATK